MLLMYFYRCGARWLMSVDLHASGPEGWYMASRMHVE